MKTTKNAKIRLLKGFEKVGDAGGKTCKGQSPVQTLILNLFLKICKKNYHYLKKNSYFEN